MSKKNAVKVEGQVAAVATSSNTKKVSAFATVQSAKQDVSNVDSMKPHIVHQIARFVYFLVKCYCDNKKHVNKEVMEDRLVELEVETLQAWRDFLFQKVSDKVTDEKTGKITRVANDVPPAWEVIPPDMQHFINSCLDEDYNYKMVAQLLTQAMPSKYTGPVQLNSTGLFNLLERKPEVQQALRWWADIGYPNLDSVDQSLDKYALLIKFYNNELDRNAWWAREGVYLRYADRQRQY